MFMEEVRIIGDQSIAERVWKGSGWNVQHALETLRNKCLVEERDRYNHDLRMHDHLRDLGREMALELSPPHRLWRPQDLKSLELRDFRNILTKTNYLTVQCGRFEMLWENRIQVPSQLKELRISQISLKRISNVLGISDNLENVFIDAQGLSIQGLSLLESLGMNLPSLYLIHSTVKGEHASTKIGERTTGKSLVICNFKLSGEGARNNGGMSSNVKVPTSGLQKLEISNQELVSKILISGIHYSSLESIKLHLMQYLKKVDLIRVNTLTNLDIRNCRKLKNLKSGSGIFDLPKLVELNISQCPELKELNLEHLICLVKIIVVDCKHLKNVSGIFNLPKLMELNISQCPKFKELTLDHLMCLEKITVVDCKHLKNISERPNLPKLMELTICQCPELKALTLGPHS
ncbi:hypothetical protein SUGI_0040290 [Cryptomeria japonica]|nr:hypothetical protein SUGI_0040290 [Cryptomeria japonica]